MILNFPSGYFNLKSLHCFLKLRGDNYGDESLMCLQQEICPFRDEEGPYGGKQRNAGVAADGVSAS